MAASEGEVVVLHELENHTNIARIFLSVQEPCHGGIASIATVMRHTFFLYLVVDGVEYASQGHCSGHFASGEVE